MFDVMSPPPFPGLLVCPRGLIMLNTTSKQVVLLTGRHTPSLMSILVLSPPPPVPVCLYLGCAGPHHAQNHQQAGYAVVMFSPLSFSFCAAAPPPLSLCPSSGSDHAEHHQQAGGAVDQQSEQQLADAARHTHHIRKRPGHRKGWDYLLH